MIGGIASMIGQGINAIQTRRNTKRTIDAQKKESELAFQRDKEMWNMQNAYNTPQMQMERFKEAGLNPHLIYGQGNAGNATSTPNYNAIKPDYSQNIAPIDPMAILGAYQDFRLRNAEIDKVQSEASLRKSEAYHGFSYYMDRASKLKHDAIISSQNRDMNATKLGWWNYSEDGKRTQGWKMLDSQLNAREANVHNIAASTGQKLAAIDKMNTDTSFTEKKMEWYLFQMFSKLGLEAVDNVLKMVPLSKAGRAVKSGKSGLPKPESGMSTYNRMRKYAPKY